MSNETQLPQEWKTEIRHNAEAYADNIDYPERCSTNAIRRTRSGIIEDYEAGATAYSLRAYEAERERDELKKWKESAKALLNPVWDFADANVKMSLGECKIQAVLNHFAALKAQADKMVETLKAIRKQKEFSPELTWQVIANRMSGLAKVALADYQGKKEGGGEG